MLIDRALRDEGTSDEIVVADSGRADRTVELAAAAGARIVVEHEREPGSMRAHQILAGHIAGAVMRLLYGVRYSDRAPFRAIRRDALFGLGMREMTYGSNLEMQMRAARAGLRILEIPVAHRRRVEGVGQSARHVQGGLPHHRHPRARRSRTPAAGQNRETGKHGAMTPNPLSRGCGCRLAGAGSS